MAIVAETTYFLHSFDGKLLAEYNGTGQVMREYIYAGGMLVAEYVPATAKYYYYTTDQIRSSRVITDQSGTVVYSAQYDPYGGLITETVTGYTPNLKFSGKEREKESGLDYFGARYYDNRSFRFLSVDPIINKDEALVNPQLWNLYSYCRNNPVTFFDPDGRESNLGMHLLLQDQRTVQNVSRFLQNNPALLPLAAATGIAAPFVGPALISRIASVILGLPAAKRVYEAIQSSRVWNSPQIQEGARALAKKLGHAAAQGYQSAFEGIKATQANAEILIKNIMSNADTIIKLKNYTDFYNAAGQGVRLEKGTNVFVTFLEKKLIK